MRVYYIECRKCGRLSPSPAYFYNRGELTEEQKKTCIWEVMKEKGEEALTRDEKEQGLQI